MRERERGTEEPLLSYLAIFRRGEIKRLHLHTQAFSNQDCWSSSQGKINAVVMQGRLGGKTSYPDPEEPDAHVANARH